MILSRHSIDTLRPAIASHVVLRRFVRVVWQRLLRARWWPERSGG